MSAIQVRNSSLKYSIGFALSLCMKNSSHKQLDQSTVIAYLFGHQRRFQHGSEVYSAVEMGRKGIGMELKKSYFDQAVRNIGEIYRNRSAVDIFEETDE